MIIPQELPGFPKIALALVDFIGALAKIFTISASREIKQIGNDQLLKSGGNVEPEEFAAKGAKLIEEQIADRGSLAFNKRDPETNLGDSYFYLASILDLGKANSGQKPNTASTSREDVIYRRFLNIDERKLQAIAVDGESASSQGSFLIESDEPSIKAWAQRDASEIKAIIKWAFVMLQSRCSHVLRYLRTVSTADTESSDVANILVDYDRWLGEGPASGSRHADQVAFWTRFADVSRRVGNTFRPHTFAGYDPLKHTEDRKELQAGQAHFDVMKQWVVNGQDPDSPASHKIAGFKLYPPMGFSPHKNADLEPSRERAGKIVRRRWRDKGWNISKFGRDIDAALDEFFQYCAAEDTPIIAHGRESNGASPMSKFFGDPLFWVDRAEIVASYGTNPLRLSIGHFDLRGNDAEALDKLLAMNVKKTANVFFDLSYDPNILGNNAAYLLRQFETRGEAISDFLMFGSDWIMLGQEKNANAYLEHLHKAVAGIDFWTKHKDKLLRTNFHRFIGLGTPAQDSAAS